MGPAQKKTRPRWNAPGLTASKRNMAMNDFNPINFGKQSPAEIREVRRAIVFHCDSLDDALDQVILYARDTIDQVFAVNGMPRAALPWRIPADICPATAILAAHDLAQDRGFTGAQMLADAMFRANTDCVVDGLCVAEDIAIVTDNFTERFGDDA